MSATAKPARTASYPYDEVVNDFFEERGLELPTLTGEQWAEFEDVMNDCQSEISEQRSYGRPSFADMVEMNARPKIAALEAESKRLRGDLEIHEKSVMSRRGASEVYIEGRQVMYR